MANQLLHIRGSIGGTLRRKGEYAAAAAACDRGREIERPEAEYGIVNSYNLVQALVARVFVAPDALLDRDRTVEGVRLPGALEAARDELLDQIAGPRANDEYAAADLAMVRLLLDDPTWERSLDEFIEAEPEPYAVDVTLELLEALRTRVGEAPGALPDLFERLSTAVDLLKTAV